ncbi:Gfo/Idh/MocA family oxidoreductase [Nesterenkonia sp. YGD6]|uniref:Gfo/Idh/MocA family protein n=1 Tax=Nesterenkonia sp. YGD6 TaxID=2901231 RepID=UPI001F4D09DB|nr:Gfo/Idh/MocA family oxidoreductase [Nesterenkonia sp. YGD6]MCH8563675.1 Gfo/Idh/MocA family oxidoreductase [Nesterenkonia sp. YGD6]
MTTTVGLIGVGRIGAMHATNLQALVSHDVDLVITDFDTARANQIAANLGCRAVEDTEELFAQQPDGVVIAVGTQQHAPLILRAINAGVPVFCEKPVAESVEASRPVLEEIQRLGATVQIGHQRRLDVGYLEARRAFRSGELGWLHTIRALTGDMFPPPTDFLATSGGLFRDCSVHDFDILQWITGRQIVEIYARGSNNGDPTIGAVGDVDSAVALATFDDGTVATVSATRYNGAGHDVRLELHGSKGTIQAGLDSSYAGSSAETDFVYPAGPTHRTFHQRFAEAYREEMRSFVQLIRGERENPCAADEAVDASRVADAAQRSLETGVPVQVAR